EEVIGWAMCRRLHAKPSCVCSLLVMEVSAVYAQTALVLADSKAAALYFDYVLPLLFPSVVERTEEGVRLLEQMRTLEVWPKDGSFGLEDGRFLLRLRKLAPPALQEDNGKIGEKFMILLICVMRHKYYPDDTGSKLLTKCLQDVWDLFPGDSLSIFGE